MNIDTASRAKRIFKNIKRFRDVSTLDRTRFPTEIPIAADEHVLGIYENVPNSLQKCVVVTDRQLLIESNGSWLAISYDDIVDVHTPSPADAIGGNLGLEIQYLDRTAVVPIEGRNGRFHDLFEFSRFLNHLKGHTG